MQTIAQKQKFVKANRGLTTIATVAEIQAMDESALDAVIAEIQAKLDESKPAEQSTPADAVQASVESNDTFTNDKGEVIPVLNAVFERKTTGGALLFVTATGERIFTNDNDVMFAVLKGTIKDGDVVAFRPDTLQYREQLNGYNAIPNKSATPAIMKVLEYRQGNKDFNKLLETEMIAQGISPEEARKSVQEDIKAKALAGLKRPTFGA